MFNHITPILKSLHWVPILQCCAFKTALLTFKAIHGQAPSYISELIKYHNLVISGLSMIYYLMFLGLNCPMVPELLLCLHLHFGIVCLMIFILVFLCTALNPNSRYISFLLLF